MLLAPRPRVAPESSQQLAPPLAPTAKPKRKPRAGYKRAAFMERAWTWERLVPWTVGCVLLKDYMDYLKKYLKKNDYDPDLCVEAERVSSSIHQTKLCYLIDCLAKSTSLQCYGLKCLKMEKKYARSFAGHLCEKDASLSCEIINLAEKMLVSGSSSVTAAAGLRCIANEARLMSNFGTHSKMFKFSNVVRLYASKLMLYEGPEAESVAAVMLGMGKEASLAHKFQKTIDEPESYESLHVCKVVRDCTLSLLIHLTRDDALEALATSRTDMTEGYAISEKSADDDIVGNKKSKEKNKSKKRKRDLEIKESEATVESAGTVTKVSGNKESKEKSKSKSKKRKRDLEIKESEGTVESAGTVIKRFVSDNILGGFDLNQQLHEDNCDADATVNGNAAFVSGPGTSSFVPGPESVVFVPGPESAASGNAAEEAADEISSHPVVPYVGMMNNLASDACYTEDTYAIVSSMVDEASKVVTNMRRARNGLQQQPDKLEEDIQPEQHEVQQQNNEAQQKAAVDEAHGSGNLRNSPRNKPKGRPKETEKRHKPLVELREDANKKREKKASEPKSKKEPAPKLKRMKLARQADEAKAAGVELRL
ncbi:hypothetical protein ACQ4PT_055647 [Festuca glaucescens]